MLLLRTAIYTFLFVIAADLGAQNSTVEKVLDVRAPIGIAAAGSNAYFVATRDGTVFEYKNDNGSLRYDRQCALPTFYHPTDVAGSQDANGSPMAFVTAWSTVTNRGLIARCVESGASMAILTTFTDDIPACIAYSPGDSSLYYVGTRNSELRKIGLDLKNDKFIDELSSVQHPGAMAFSPDARYLFVADLNDQKIVQFDLQKRRNSHVVLNEIGYPSAISYDANTGIIYAADFSARQIVLVNVRNGDSHKLKTIRSSSFKGIEGLAPGPAGGLLIADNEANAVFLSSDQP